MDEEPLEPEFRRVAEEFDDYKKEFKDPVFLATLMQRLSQERTSSNLLLKQINEKLDRLLDLEARIASLEQKIENSRSQAPATRTQKTAEPSEAMLPEVDEQIVSFIKEKGAACAADVKAKFGYKGSNAACARLNRLFDQGLLRKKQVGRKVFYVPST